tara:strand:- start:2288 stop:3028 length:741 start_codon:yes stop_codon:yes gene_type:complete
MPLVSIILPFFKKIDYIFETINSVLNQTFQDFEIILIYDDTKLDDLKLIEKRFINNSKIKIIKNEQNFGAGLSRNIGIAHSKGEIIAFIDADDLWKPRKLEKQIEFMKINNLDFTFCNYKKKLPDKEINVVSSKKIISYKDLLKSCDIGLSTVQLNKKIVDKDLFPNLKTKEDYVAWLKLTKKKINAFNLPENLVIWQSVKGSLSSNFLQKILDGFRVYKQYEGFGIIKSLIFLLVLSVNSINKKF